MTRTANARIAGSMYLLYIVAGVAGMALFARASAGGSPAARLAAIAQHQAAVRVSVLLTLLQLVIPVVLAAALYALTRDQDRDVAVMALSFRVGEGVLAAVASVRTLGLLSIATAISAAPGPDAADIALGSLLLAQGGSSGLIGATSFAVGSTLFSWLFLRARSIPVPLASLGVVSSALLVVALPLQLAGFLHGTATRLAWIPMLVFEVTFAAWLLVKGVASPATAPRVI